MNVVQCYMRYTNLPDVPGNKTKTSHYKVFFSSVGCVKVFANTIAVVNSLCVYNMT